MFLPLTWQPNRLPFDLGPGTTAALAIALLGAAFVRGYSGFGFSAIFIAFAALLTNPLPLIPVIFACEITMTAFQARAIRPHVDWPRALTLLAGAAVALPVFLLVPLFYVLLRLEIKPLRAASDEMLTSRAITSPPASSINW